MTDYDDRYCAINDALWLVQHGPRDPQPPVPDPNVRTRGVDFPFVSYSREIPSDQGDPRYAEISLALDIARFLLDEELPEDVAEDDRV